MEAGSTSVAPSRAEHQDAAGVVAVARAGGADRVGHCGHDTLSAMPETERRQQPSGRRALDELGDATRRTRLANERTYLAWWRTGLTAIAVSLAAGRVVPTLAHATAWPYELAGAGFAVLGALGQRREPPQRLRPLAQLGVRIEIVEPLGRAASAHIPRRGVPAVQAQVGGGGGRCHHGRHEIAGVRARCVDDHVGRAPLLEERQHLRRGVLLEPASVPELDQHLVAPELVLRPLDVLVGCGLA